MRRPANMVLLAKLNDKRTEQPMFKGLLTKTLSRNDAVVKRGAKDAQKGKRNLPVDAFAQKGRDAKDDKKAR